MSNDKVKVLVEIPEGSNIKYELNEETRKIELDRILPTSMFYPVNYGLIDETKGEDGDALDALVFLSAQIAPGTIVKTRIIGVLRMEDEAGMDYKLICVPESPKIDPICGKFKTLADIDESKKLAIKHFFEHYKDLEKDKWVKLSGWGEKEEALQILEAGIKRLKEEK
jgi:inorganic pyrophosphatase